MGNFARGGCLVVQPLLGVLGVGAAGYAIALWWQETGKEARRGRAQGRAAGEAEAAAARAVADEGVQI